MTDEWITSRPSADTHRTFPGAALFHIDDFKLLWCNECYLALLPDQGGSDSFLGRPLLDISPVTFVTRRDAMVRAAETGEVQRGTDRVFSVEHGVDLYHWEIHRPQPDTLLTLVVREKARPPLTN